ncbi:AAA family ATPase [Limosilactobacillus reuteri]|uniref:AAA family ATPase n=1 Tax=Limosilactobacillus reuteri TaxID=1598 RepID=UPI001C5AA419|nr:AAA family ATPase [Limosilactobacillus reuteri]MBW3349722.1 AAA family ATPase [Limosilactobacillus reuteri]UUW67577.1 AAA family ATPase [Limosilactobacillus reuteri]
MYLKSLSIKNYRKFESYGESGEGQIFKFAHSRWPKNITSANNENENIEETEKYISQSTSLLVGKNNAGKSTVIKLLNVLQSKRCGSRNAFSYTDFNLNYLHKWYDEYILNPSLGKKISPKDLPYMEFELKIGIDDGNDNISNFKDVLVIGGLTEIENNNVDADIAEVTIIIRYEVANAEKFIAELNVLKESEHNKDNSKETSYYKELNYRKFLTLFDDDYYILNFYPLESDEPAEQFSLVPLLKVDVVEANTVKNADTLSKAYSKIVLTYAKNNHLDGINEIVDSLSSQIKNMVDKNVKGILQNAVSAIESSRNLQMNLYPDVTLEKIFTNNIIYEYQENSNNIPESQYGMGYTNLMVIIAKIVDYLELYKEDDINGAINILCIEEPESFMHPQMQEQFIKNIAKAIAMLLGKKNEFDTFQLLITTHSSHILNSKIQSGNTLNNIIYLGSPNGQNIIVNIMDEILIDGEDKKYEYIKKYLRLEAIDVFFADAIILVEGISEETYLRYLIDKEELNTYHIKVYRIDGAFAHKFISLLKLIKVRTVVLTDLDIRREKDDNNKPIEDNIKDLAGHCTNSNDCLTTNGALKAFIKQSNNIADDDNNAINEEIVDSIGEKEYLKIKLSETDISIYSQGKINGSYATSFEEAIILTNGKDRNLQSSLITLLGDIHPRAYSQEKLEKESFLENSFKYQYGIASAQGKEKFSTDLVYYPVIKDGFVIKEPEYISLALQELRESFEER